MDIITRSEAAAQGFKKYRTGKPCSRGHDAPRYTTSGICTACHSHYAQANRTRWVLRQQGVAVIELRVPHAQVALLESLVRGCGIPWPADVANVMPPEPVVIIPPGPKLPPPPAPSEPMDLSQWGLLTEMPAQFRLHQSGKPD